MEELKRETDVKAKQTRNLPFRREKNLHRYFTSFSGRTPDKTFTVGPTRRVWGSFRNSSEHIMDAPLAPHLEPVLEEGQRDPLVIPRLGDAVGPRRSVVHPEDTSRESNSRSENRDSAFLRSSRYVQLISAQFFFGWKRRVILVRQQES